MDSVDKYRDMADYCLRQIVAEQDERDRPLWATLARSWLQLADDVSRATHDMAQDIIAQDISGDFEPGEERRVARPPVTGQPLYLRLVTN